MPSLSSLAGGGGLVPKSIVKGSSAKISAVFNLAGSITSGVQVLSGACTASTLKTILSVTGRGCISYLAGNTVDSTSRSNRVKITLDGTVIYDTTETAAADQSLIQIIGCLHLNQTGGFIGVTENQLLFNSSLLIEYATNLTETDKFRFVYNYYTR